MPEQYWPKPLRITWSQPAPTHCTMTGVPIVDEFVEGWIWPDPTWRCYHPEYHRSVGGRLGTGHGQRYQRQLDGTWLRIEG